jgi:hypothetical protein
MKHNYIAAAEALNSSSHYAVGTDGQGNILIQLDDGTNQVRIKLDLNENRHLRGLLFDAYFSAFDEISANRPRSRK